MTVPLIAGWIGWFYFAVRLFRREVALSGAALAGPAPRLRVQVEGLASGLFFAALLVSGLTLSVFTLAS